MTENWNDVDSPVAADTADIEGSKAAVAMLMNSSTSKKVIESRVDSEGHTVIVAKRITITTTTRPRTLADVRGAIWKPFGAAVKNDPGLTVVEAPVSFELGAADPIEKATREEIIKQMNAAMLRGDRKTPALPRHLQAAYALATKELTTPSLASEVTPQTQLRSLLRQNQRRAKRGQRRALSGAVKRRRNVPKKTPIALFASKTSQTIFLKQSCGASLARRMGWVRSRSCSL